jgi:hypothetical protein
VIDDYEFFHVDPNTGLPFEDFSEEEFAAVLHARETHLPDPDYIEQLSGKRSRNDAQKIDRGEIVVPTLRPLAGRQANNRGNSAVIEPNRNLVTIVESGKDSGPDAESIVVALGLEIANDSNHEHIRSREAIDIKAVIDFGVGGADYRALVDWQQGMVLTVPASYIRVSALYNHHFEHAPKVKLDASLSYGFVGHRGTGGRYTQDLGIVAPGARTGFVQIPKFAASFSIVTQNKRHPFRSSQASMIVSSHNGAIGVGIQNAYQYSSGSNRAVQTEDQFALFNSARFMNVRNDGEHHAHMMLIYSLSL